MPKTKTHSTAAKVGKRTGPNKYDAVITRHTIQQITVPVTGVTANEAQQKAQAILDADKNGIRELMDGDLAPSEDFEVAIYG
jgi:hypothetical protein